jgi:MarR family transcriptional regulator, lower aerobic nicotinate degradation pathway regulator
MTTQVLSADDQLKALYDRPGFLIRRANQIAVSIFLAEMESAVPGLTTTQYGALVVLGARDGLAQASLARLVGIDRSTTTLVVAKLEADGFIERSADETDKRRKILKLTVMGRAALRSAEGPALTAREKLLSAFTKTEAAAFHKLLKKLVDRFNEEARAPIEV